MQVLVVGAGIVGLAIAREAAMAGHDVIVAEAEGHIGSGTSSRNSEVIHAGIYYTTGSLRERHCARSRRLLYAYCESHGVPHKKLGKLVVASRIEDIPALEKIFAQGERTATVLNIAQQRQHIAVAVDDAGLGRMERGDAS